MKNYYTNKLKRISVIVRGTFSRINFAAVTAAIALAFGAAIMVIWNQAFSAAAEAGRISFWQALLILGSAFLWMQVERFLTNIRTNK